MRVILNIFKQLWNQFSNANLRSKLTLAFLLVSLGSVAILVLFNTRFVQTALTNEANRALEVAAKQTADNIHTFLNNSIVGINSEAQIPALRDYLLLPTDQRFLSNEQAGVTRTLRFFKNQNPWFLSYALSLIHI